MDRPRLQNLRIAPTVQQGGTQTIQQSIYLNHQNPCGLNLLIFERIGHTGIRYIDLKNYLDAIIDSEEMTQLFQNVKEQGTLYMNNTVQDNETEFLYALQLWGQAGIRNLPVPVDFYSGYTFYFSVYETTGSMIFDSKFPDLVITDYYGDTLLLNNLFMFPNPHGLTSIQFYQINVVNVYSPWIDTTNPIGFLASISPFMNNQMAYPESIMAISSLLVDSANTRSFGIPRYGFCARPSADEVGALSYCCAHIINIYSVPKDDQSSPTLITSVMVRLTLEENFNYFSSSSKLSLQKRKMLSSVNPSEYYAKQKNEETLKIPSSD